MSAATETKFDDVMIAMDVVDTLRHESNLVETELSGDQRRAALVEKLRTIYLTQGLAVSDDILNRAVDELEERRFVHEPLKPGLQHTLATIYVRRVRYALRSAVGAVVMAVLVGGPIAIMNKIENDRIAAEVAAAKTLALLIDESLPRELDAAAKAALRVAAAVPGSEAKIATVGRLEQDAKAALAARNVNGAQTAIAAINGIRAGLDRQAAVIARQQARDLTAKELMGKAAAGIAEAREAAKDSKAKAAVDALATDLDRLAKAGEIDEFTIARLKLASLVEEIKLPLTIRIVDRKGVNAGVWRVRENDPKKVRVYYLVVEAERADGMPVERDVRNSENGQTSRVKTWALRVPREVYERVKDDKTSDGIINDREVGFKAAGALDIKWSVPTGGETITKW